MKARERRRSRVLVVDGYNVLNALGPPLELGGSLADARDALADRLEDYAGFSGQRVVLVFDAWLSDRKQRSQEDRGALTVVFTRKGETADHYIERLCDDCAQDVADGRMELRVATSDNVEQTVVFGRGAVRISARELLFELEGARRTRQEHGAAGGRAGGTLADRLPEDIRRRLEEMRRGQ
jgi:predicted RNA-binding protein with PIN domain